MFLKSATYPLHSVKIMSGFVQMYSTVGVRVPICLLRMLLKIWTASFFPSKSMRWRFRKSAKSKPVLYISWLNWARTISDCWSDSLPNRSCFIFVSCRDKSSWAWKIKKSRECKKAYFVLVYFTKKLICFKLWQIFRYNWVMNFSKKKMLKC